MSKYYIVPEETLDILREFSLKSAEVIEEHMMVNFSDDEINNMVEAPKEPKKPLIYYQPEFNDEGNIIGHEHDTCYSFQVWYHKENLLKAFPNCTPVQYKDDDIEDPVFED